MNPKLEHDNVVPITIGAKLFTWLRDAQWATLEPIGDQEVTDKPGEPPPRFPTGLSSWEDKTRGGGYGCTCIAGEPKCGKSMLALSCAIEAARDDVPWRVLYFDAELSRYELANRIRNYLGREPTESLAEYLSFHMCESGVSIQGVVERVATRMQLQDEGLLIVLDSLNRFVKLSQSSGTDSEHWARMRSWLELFRVAAKTSGGKVASVIVSELAGAGHVKGREAEYMADLVVRIVRCGEDGYFDVDIPFARSSAGGRLGKHWLDWERGRFICVDSTE